MILGAAAAATPAETNRITAARTQLSAERNGTRSVLECGGGMHSCIGTRARLLEVR